MDLMTFISLTCRMAIHSACKTASSWCNVWGCRALFRTLLSSESQICSIGDTSGDSDGHGIISRFCYRLTHPNGSWNCPAGSYPRVVPNEVYDDWPQNLISVVHCRHSTDCHQIHVSEVSSLHCRTRTRTIDCD